MSYAKGTTVPVSTSRGEITGLLAKYGVERQAWSTEPEGDILMFHLGNRVYKISIRRPTQAELARHYTKSASPTEWQQRLGREWMRRWRANVLLLKAKLEFADEDDTTIERELMPFLVLADGRTLEQVVETDGVPIITGVPLLGA